MAYLGCAIKDKWPSPNGLTEAKIEEKRVFKGKIISFKKLISEKKSPVCFRNLLTKSHFQKSIFKKTKNGKSVQVVL